MTQTITDSLKIIYEWRVFMGKKDRNRLRQKKNNHTPDDVVRAKEIAHSKEYSATGRKQ